jgi:hypothetical protein
VAGLHEILLRKAACPTVSFAQQSDHPFARDCDQYGCSQHRSVRQGGSSNLPHQDARAESPADRREVLIGGVGCSRSCTDQNTHRFSTPASWRSPEPTAGIGLGRRRPAATARVCSHNRKVPRIAAARWYAWWLPSLHDSKGMAHYGSIVLEFITDSIAPMELSFRCT